MTILFPKVGLIGKHTNPEVQSTLQSLALFLQTHQIEVIVEQHCAQLMDNLNIRQAARNTIGSLCDLIIVIGGDGSFLDAARSIVDNNVPVIGVNRGRRGFLTDISPQALTQLLDPLLNGAFTEEKRFLLEMEIWRQGKKIHQGMALNEVTFYSGDIAKIIEFQVLIDNQYVYRQRSDGLITATPTGSTAYALAGGGPILHPSLDAFVLVPMHPAVLSSRPIVVKSSSTVELHLMPENLLHPRVSCDGQLHFDANADDRILIKRKAKELRLLHPTDYDYYYTLRSKLGWSS